MAEPYRIPSIWTTPALEAESKSLLVSPAIIRHIGLPANLALPIYKPDGGYVTAEAGQIAS